MGLPENGDGWSPYAKQTCLKAIMPANIISPNWHAVAYASPIE